jgi:hypothetical protein
MGGELAVFQSRGDHGRGTGRECDLIIDALNK